jgi:uncharacterized protein YndB with AHSA1/START domain
MVSAVKPIVIERELPHRPEKVWRALTQRGLIDYWLMLNDFEPIVGHRFKLWSDIGSSWNVPIDCEVLEVKPYRRLSYRWGSGGARTTVAWTLSPTKNGVRLRMEQRAATGSYRRSVAEPGSFFDDCIGKTFGGLYVQTVPIAAEWFRKPDGAPWVKFVFGARSPVDLQVALKGDTLWFTGVHGTGYELSPAGPNRLTGRSRRLDGPLDLSSS